MPLETCLWSREQADNVHNNAKDINYSIFEISYVHIAEIVTMVKLHDIEA